MTSRTFTDLSYQKRPQACHLSGGKLPAWEMGHSTPPGSPRRASPDRIQVGLHDACDPAVSRETGKIVGAAAVLSGEVPQRLDGDIDADLVAVLEAVRDRLGGGIDPQGDSFGPMGLDPFRQGWAGEASDPQPRIIERRTARLLRESDPDLGRRLSRQVMEPERGEKTEHRPRNTPGNLCKRVFRRRFMVGQRVDAPRLANDQTPFHQLRQVRPRYTLPLEVPGTGDSELRNGPEGSPLSFFRHRRQYLQNVGVYLQAPTICLEVGEVRVPALPVQVHRLGSPDLETGAAQDVRLAARLLSCWSLTFVDFTSMRFQPWRPRSRMSGRTMTPSYSIAAS